MKRILDMNTARQVLRTREARRVVASVNVKVDVSADVSAGVGVARSKTLPFSSDIGYEEWAARADYRQALNKRARVLGDIHWASNGAMIAKAGGLEL